MVVFALGIALHCEGLATSSLAVSENCPVVALQAAVGDGSSDCIEHGLLGEARVPDKVEREGLQGVAVLVLEQKHPALVDLDAVFRLTIELFPFIERSDMDHNLDIV